MTRRHELEGVVRSWLREDGHEDADRVLFSVLDELDTTPQRQASWLARRFPNMSNTLRFAIGAVVVVIVAALGLRYLGPATGSSADATPTPTPTPLATPMPSPSAPNLPPEGTQLEAGTYSISIPDSPVVATLTIGDGWTSGGWYIMNPPTFSRSLSFWTVGNVYSDACDTEGSLPEPAIGPTADDLTAALDAQANTDMSTPRDVVVGGYQGKRAQMRVPETVDCNPPLPMWVDQNGSPGRSIDRPINDTVWILDVEGNRIVIVGSAIDAGADATVEDVIDTIEFTVE